MVFCKNDFWKDKEKSRKHITFESIEKESNKQLIFILYTLSEKRDIFEEKLKTNRRNLNWEAFVNTGLTNRSALDTVNRY